MMDARYEASKLCRILSHPDICPVPEYISNNPAILDEMIEEITQEEEMKRQLKACEDEYANKKRPSSSLTESVVSSNRKHRTDVDGSGTHINSLESEVDLQGKIALLRERLAKIESACKRKCIQDGNRSTTQVLKQDFLDRRMELESTSQKSHSTSITGADEALNVVCVSSPVFHKLGKVNKTLLPHKGYNSKAETGIPGFRTFCKESTYAAREDDLQKSLE